MREYGIRVNQGESVGMGGNIPLPRMNRFMSLTVSLTRTLTLTIALTLTLALTLALAAVTVW